MYAASMFVELGESLPAASDRAVTVPRIEDCAGESAEESSGIMDWIGAADRNARREV